MKGSFAAVGLGACLAICVAGNASAAAIISGQANVNGSVTVTSTQVLFDPTLTVSPGSTETGSFMGITGGTIGQLTGQPVGTPINVVGFATFTGGAVNPIDFDLTEILPGVGTMANCNNTLGAACTPNGSPFTLYQEQNGVDVTLNLDGVSYGAGGSGKTGSPTIAGFTTQIIIPGTTVTAILTNLSMGGSEKGVSYSATFTATPLPEPKSFWMLLGGIGLMGLGLAKRKARASTHS